MQFQFPPTALITQTVCGKDAWVAIATLDGTLHVLRVGGFGSGRGDKPFDIKETGIVRVGNNPVCLMGVRNKWFDEPARHSEIVVVSRGDRELEWVQLNKSGGTVTKVLRDKRLVDPVHAEQLTTAMTDVDFQFLNVCDFAGQQVVQYRFGPATAKPAAPPDRKKGASKESEPAREAPQEDRPGGMGLDGKAPFECTGVLALPGNPLQSVNANCH
jgi:hypothetical protein